MLGTEGDSVLTSSTNDLRPIQMLMKKLKRPDSVDGVRSVKKLDSGSIANFQIIVQAPHFRVFGNYPIVGRDAIVMSALDHERTRRDQCRQFRIIEPAANAEFRHLIFGMEHITH